jgi:uncharacterized protein DUF4124
VKFLIALIVLLAPMAAQAQLLKCVGKDGKVEYAAECPTGSKEQQTGIRNTKSGPTSDTKASPQKSTAEKEADFKKRQTEQQTAATKKEEDAKDTEARKQNCENARAHLSALESGQRIVKNDPNTGERSYLDDAERGKVTAEAKRSVESWCK